MKLLRIEHRFCEFESYDLPLPPNKALADSRSSINAQ